MSLDDDIRRGDRARTLLEDGLVQEIFAELENKQIDAWKNAPARDAEAREKIWVFVKTVNAVKESLEEIAQNGTVAQSMVDKEKSARDLEQKTKQRVAAELGIRPEDIIEE